GRESLHDLEEQMRVLGAQLLVKKVGTNSATQADIDNRNEQSALHEMANSMEDALDLAIQHMATWAKVPNPGSVSVYKDFGTLVAGGQTEAVLLNAANAGKLSSETFFTEMQRRGHIDDSISWADEAERIAEQGLALGNHGLDDGAACTGCVWIYSSGKINEPPGVTSTKAALTTTNLEGGSAMAEAILSDVGIYALVNM